MPTDSPIEPEAVERTTVALQNFALALDPAHAVEVLEAEWLGEVPPSREVTAEGAGRA
jgi:hypothetical protein